MSRTPRLRNAVLWTLLAAALLTWGWLDVRRRGRIDPQNPAVHKTDFTIYTQAGAAFFDGRDPYTVKNIRGWEYLYPPLFALLVSPLHSLPPQDQVFIWFLISAAAGVVAVWECRRISLAAWRERGNPHSPPGWLGPLALLAGLLPLLNTLQRGQVGTLVLWLLLAGFRLAVIERRAWAQLVGGVVLALPIVVKLTPALPVAALLLLLAMSAPRMTAMRVVIGVALGLLLGFLVIPAFLIGWETNVRHLSHWWTAVATNANLAADTRLVFESIRNQNLTNAVHLAAGAGRLAFGGDQVWLNPLTGALTIVVAVLLLAAVVRAARRGTDSLTAAAIFGLAGVASLLLSPVSWGHHYVLLIPAAAFGPLHLLSGGRRRAARLLAGVPAGLTIVHYAFIETAGGFGLLGIGTLAWFTLACCAFATAPRAAVAR